MKNSRAFTLLELLIVLLIIGILIAIGLYRYQSVVEATHAKKIKAEIRAVFIHAQAYKLKNGSYAGLNLGNPDGISLTPFDGTETNAPTDSVGFYSSGGNHVLFAQKGSNGIVSCMEETSNAIVNGTLLGTDCDPVGNGGNGSGGNGSGNTPTGVLGGGPFAFTSTNNAEGLIDVYMANTDGSGLLRLSAADPGNSSDTFIIDQGMSPDGSKILVNNANGLVVVNTNNTNAVTLFPRIGNSGFASDPRWSPDGTKVAFIYLDNNTPGGPYSRVAVTSAASNTTQYLTTSTDFGHANHYLQSLAWSPAGDKIVYSGFNFPSGTRDMYVIDISGNSPTTMIQDSLNHREEQLKWVGDYIYYKDPNLQGPNLQRIFRINVNTEVRTQITTEADRGWNVNSNGTEMFYSDADDLIYRIPTGGGAKTAMVIPDLANDLYGFDGIQLSPDGAYMLFYGYGDGNECQCYAPTSGSGHTPTPISVAGHNIWLGQASWAR
jgi:prepilin-type N-terminal cleavage/methylation domain-containing protein